MKHKPIPGQALMELPATALAHARRISNKKGHAAPPGTGPEGETCGSCKHIFRKKMSKTYIKCGLMRSRWTGSYGTDIRARDSACSQWEKPTDG